MSHNTTFTCHPVDYLIEDKFCILLICAAFFDSSASAYSIFRNHGVCNSAIILVSNGLD